AMCTRDTGYTRYHHPADQWIMYEEADDPNWKFPDGLFLETYDKDMNPDATLRSDSATYFSQQKLWRLDGNVRMRNTAGDRFLTEQLFWDQNQRKVYSDSFIHIERSDRTIEGYGFVSNENMTTYTVRRPTGIFPVSDFRSNATDSVSLDSASEPQETTIRRRTAQPRIKAANT
ncbi:MAG: LPS export ABC transporter periplasmic protein LptC, partial [Muribaculaceae bacterium]|nr:LPS export ABC transporter periplasmic protein LptC [Muribaculaceae bacterium]